MTSPGLPLKTPAESSGRRGGGAGGTRGARVPPRDTLADLPVLLRPCQVAGQLGISRSKVFQLVASRELPSIHIGRSTRIPREQLDEWIAAQVVWSPRAATGLLSRLRSA
jgi:excisionase family DNA binding protein